MKKLIILFALFALAACGIADDKKLGELSSDEIKELCQEVTEETKDCGEGVTVERSIETCEESTFKSGCAGDVSNWRACNDADICDLSNNDCGKAGSCME